MTVSMEAIRQRCKAIFAGKDLLPGTEGALAALLAVGQRFSLRGDKAGLTDLDGLLSDMEARWAEEIRSKKDRLWGVMHGRRKRKDDEQDELTEGTSDAE